MRFRIDRHPAEHFGVALAWAIAIGCCAIPTTLFADPETIRFNETIQPFLDEYCYVCHGDGGNEGEMALDELAVGQHAVDSANDSWRVLRQLRAGLMPPPNEPRPSPKELESIESWIKQSAFRYDPPNRDPGRVTVRRLNRTEYRNTIRDLLGFDFDAQSHFPPDDTGDGFDNIGDVLTISPLLLEKYFDAVKSIIINTVPTMSGVVPTRVLGLNSWDQKWDSRSEGPLSLSYYEAAKNSAVVSAEHDGDYVVSIDLRAVENYVDNQFDYNKRQFVFRIDDGIQIDREFVRQGGKSLHFDFPLNWKAGGHEITVEVVPLTPGVAQIRNLRIIIDAVTIASPLGEEHFVAPTNYDAFFPRLVPDRTLERRQYARELLGDFAARAFRRPVDDETIDRLVVLAEGAYEHGDW